MSCEQEYAAFRRAANDLHAAQLAEDSIRAARLAAQIKVGFDDIGTIACFFTCTTVILCGVCFGLALGKTEADLYAWEAAEKALPAAEKARRQAQDAFNAALLAFLNCKTPPWPSPPPDPELTPPPIFPPPTTNLDCGVQFDICHRAAERRFHDRTEYTMDEVRSVAGFLAVQARVKAAEEAMRRETQACRDALEECNRRRNEIERASWGTPV